MRSINAPWIWLAIAALALLGACRANATVSSGVDPVQHPQKAEPIFFAPPSDPSIRERQTEQIFRRCLARNAFNIVTAPEEAKWVLTFSVDRETYVAGWDSSGGIAVLGNSGLAISSESSTVRRQTDVTIFVRVFSAADRTRPNPPLYWEGSVTALEKIHRVVPNAMVDALLRSFGNDSYRRMRLKKEPE